MFCARASRFSGSPFSAKKRRVTRKPSRAAGSAWRGMPVIDTACQTGCGAEVARGARRGQRRHHDGGGRQGRPVHRDGRRAHALAEHLRGEHRPGLFLRAAAAGGEVGAGQAPTSPGSAGRPAGRFRAAASWSPARRAPPSRSRTTRSGAPVVASAAVKACSARTVSPPRAKVGGELRAGELRRHVVQVFHQPPRGAEARLAGQRQRVQPVGLRRAVVTGRRRRHPRWRRQGSAAPRAARPRAPWRRRCGRAAAPRRRTGSAIAGPRRWRSTWRRSRRSAGDPGWHRRRAAGGSARSGVGFLGNAGGQRERARGGLLEAGEREVLDARAASPRRRSGPTAPKMALARQAPLTKRSAGTASGSSTPGGSSMPATSVTRGREERMVMRLSRSTRKPFGPVTARRSTPSPPSVARSVVKGWARAPVARAATRRVGPAMASPPMVLQLGRDLALRQLDVVQQDRQAGLVARGEETRQQRLGDHLVAHRHRVRRGADAGAFPGHRHQAQLPGEIGDVERHHRDAVRPAARPRRRTATTRRCGGWMASAPSPSSPPWRSTASSPSAGAIMRP